MKSALALITIGTLSAALASRCDCAGIIAYVSQYAHTGWKLLEGFAAQETQVIAQTADDYLSLASKSDLFRLLGIRSIPSASTRESASLTKTSSPSLFGMGGVAEALGLRRTYTPEQNAQAKHQSC